MKKLRTVSEGHVMSCAYTTSSIPTLILCSHLYFGRSISSKIYSSLDEILCCFSATPFTLISTPNRTKQPETQTHIRLIILQNHIFRATNPDRQSLSSIRDSLDLENQISHVIDQFWVDDFGFISNMCLSYGEEFWDVVNEMHKVQWHRKIDKAKAIESGKTDLIILSGSWWKGQLRHHRVREPFWMDGWLSVRLSVVGVWRGLPVLCHFKVGWGRL